MSYLGLDIGTSSCKACVFAGDGSLLAKASREYSINNPSPGWAQLNSREVGDFCLEVIREAARQTPQDPVDALAISSQGEAFTVLDGDGEILLDAMVSSDNRASDLIAPWVAEFGADRLYEKTGHTPHPIFSLFKLIWLRRHLPDVWSKASCMLCFEDYLHFRLGVEPAISWPLAGRTLLFNTSTADWDDDILDAIGLRRAQLARPLPSGAIVGAIPSELTNALGLAPGAMVVAGGHDQVCCALGSGVVKPGQASLSTGSVECITVALQEPCRNEILSRSNLCSYHHALPGGYASLAYNLTGGNLLHWFRDELGAQEDLEAKQTGQDVFELILERLPIGPGPLMVLPYFTASGTPFFDAKTPGAILGLRLETTRHDILLGLLEGLAFELRLNLQLLESAGIPIDEILAVGGGARSRQWLQLKADILGRPVQVPEVTETGCLGAAILSCAAATRGATEDVVARWIRMRETIEPDPGRMVAYKERFAPYRKTYETLRSLSASVFDSRPS